MLAWPCGLGPYGLQNYGNPWLGQLWLGHVCIWQRIWGAAPLWGDSAFQAKAFLATACSERSQSMPNNKLRASSTAAMSACLLSEHGCLPPYHCPHSKFSPASVALFERRMTMYASRFEDGLEGFQWIGPLLGGIDVKRAPISFVKDRRARSSSSPEAVSALDVSIKNQILKLISDLAERHNLSYLFISHDLKVIENITEKCLVMKSGKIVERGPTKQILCDPKNEYTLSLINAAPKFPDFLHA